jgi:hypothetical protein
VGEFCAAKSDREIERALVQARSVDFFAPDLGAEDSCEEIMLEAADDGVWMLRIYMHSAGQS